MRRSRNSRQGVDHRHAHAMQAAGDLVGVLVEFSAGMQLGHDDFGGGHAFFLVDVGGDAAAIVAHGAGAVGVQHHVDAVGMAGQRFVHGIVHHFIDHVVQARAVIGVADIHAGALAHGIQALQHLDAVGAIFVHIGFGHVSSLMGLILGHEEAVLAPGRSRRGRRRTATDRCRSSRPGRAEA